MAWFSRLWGWLAPGDVVRVVAPWSSAAELALVALRGGDVGFPAWLARRYGLRAGYVHRREVLLLALLDDMGGRESGEYAALFASLGVPWAARGRGFLTAADFWRDVGEALALRESAGGSLDLVSLGGEGDG